MRSTCIKDWLQDLSQDVKRRTVYLPMQGGTSSFRLLRYLSRQDRRVKKRLRHLRRRKCVYLQKPGSQRRRYRCAIVYLTFARRLDPSFKWHFPDGSRRMDVGSAVTHTWPRLSQASPEQLPWWLLRHCQRASTRCVARYSHNGSVEVFEEVWRVLVSHRPDACQATVPSHIAISPARGSPRQRHRTG